jgi:hypothetical protein
MMKNKDYNDVFLIGVFYDEDNERLRSNIGKINVDEDVIRSFRRKDDYFSISSQINSWVNVKKKTREKLDCTGQNKSGFIFMEYRSCFLFWDIRWLDNDGNEKDAWVDGVVPEMNIRMMDMGEDDLISLREYCSRY